MLYEVWVKNSGEPQSIECEVPADAAEIFAEVEADEDTDSMFRDEGTVTVCVKSSDGNIHVCLSFTYSAYPHRAQG